MCLQVIFTIFFGRTWFVFRMFLSTADIKFQVVVHSEATGKLWTTLLYNVMYVWQALAYWSTAWWSYLLTSLDAPELHASSDVSESISQHLAMAALGRWLWWVQEDLLHFNTSYFLTGYCIGMREWLAHSQLPQQKMALQAPQCSHQHDGPHKGSFLHPDVFYRKTYANTQGCHFNRVERFECTDRSGLQYSITRSFIAGLSKSGEKHQHLFHCCEQEWIPRLDVWTLSPIQCGQIHHTRRSISTKAKQTTGKRLTKLVQEFVSLL